MDPRDLVDVDRYPLEAPGSSGYRDALALARRCLADDGCAVLRGFVRAERIPGLVAECDAQAPHGHRSHQRTNAYFTRDDPTLPPDHPKRRFYDRSNAFIPADRFGADSALRAIYEWPPFAPFIQSALEESNFHRYADPLADVIVNMASEGGGFPWHFDTNNFTVTLAIQNAERGGAFEYAPDIRRDGENFEAVAAVLDDRSDRVKRLHLEPGDLQIFKGRHSLHRVAPLAGPTSRYVGIFSYVEEPDMVATPERCLQLYGKVLPVHHERAGRRADTLLD